MERVRAFLWRAVAALLVGILLMLLPLPLPAHPRAELVKNGVVVFLLVTYLGKLLYDTLFYDRYWP